MATLSAVTFDCSHALDQATFWAGVLDWDVAPDGTAEFALAGGPKRPTDAPSMMFFQVPEPKVAKNRNHVDVHTSVAPFVRARRVLGRAAAPMRRGARSGTLATLERCAVPVRRGLG
ncbi:MAG: VOC family protein, partial [Ilumatobacteraceae bacterium]